MIQLVCWLLAIVGCALLGPQYLTSVAWAGVLVIAAQAFWIWRSLGRFGDPHSHRYLAGTLAGIIGKWAIILIGLVLLWSRLPDVSVAATVITVFALNTLAALAAPISISHPRSRVDNG
ncbi:hypothetical protein [Marinimicrobium locisalis]|uniref:hypothetical protein n=1 Tax=Marinimicrobium locisalis TaxID=546022 RepID=UPI003221B4F2